LLQRRTVPDVRVENDADDETSEEKDMFVNRFARLDRFAGASVAAAALGVVGVVVGGLGIASASSGGVFILGEHNSAMSTTTLNSSKGPALALKSRHGKPPLTVNSKAEVKHLNAAMVGGSTASSLKTSGSGAATHYPLNVDANVGTTPVLVASTAKLKKGTYYVVATAMVEVPNSETGMCAVSTSDLTKSSHPLGQSGTAQAGIGTLSETLPLKVASGAKIGEYCWMVGAVGGSLDAAGITALHVDSSTAGRTASGQPEA
jgi:hypothetical protein